MTLSKKQLRAEALLNRQSISAENYKAWSEAICGQLQTLLAELPSPQTIALYMPTRNEPDIISLGTRHAPRATIFCLPIPDPATRLLTFRRWQPGDALTKDPYGIPCPLPEAGAVTPNILLIPCLAFDRKGYRLGYGGGYYDATLSHLHATPHSTLHTLITIGIAFALQEIPAFPAESFDQRLDRIVTERETINVKPI